MSAWDILACQYDQPMHAMQSTNRGNNLCECGLLARDCADGRNIIVGCDHADQKPAEEKPRENSDSGGRGYIRHDEADYQVQRLHEHFGVGRIQQRPYGSDGTKCGTDTYCPRKHIMNTTV